MCSIVVHVNGHYYHVMRDTISSFTAQTEGYYHKRLINSPNVRTVYIISCQITPFITFTYSTFQIFMPSFRVFVNGLPKMNQFCCRY